MQAIFYGIGAAVIGIITVSGYKLVRKSLARDWLLWSIAIVLAISTAVTEKENIWLIIAGGAVVWFYRVPLARRILNTWYPVPVLLQVQQNLLQDEKLAALCWFFFKAGAFVFGSGLAIVPFLYGGVVKEYNWLNEQQFLDSVAVAMITPGPVVITVGFIGYLVAGVPGACVAAFATFLPCYLCTVLPAPYFRKYGKNPGIKAWVDGITAGAIGAIAGAVFVLGKRQLTDLPSICIAIITILILLQFRNVREPLIILLAALTGLLIRFISS